MIKVEVKPIEGFEEDYNRYVARKAQVEEELKAEYDKAIEELKAKYDEDLASRVAKLDELIKLTSEEVEVEVEDEEVVEEEVAEVEDGSENGNPDEVNY